MTSHVVCSQESEGGHRRSRKRKRDAYSFDDAEGDGSSSEDEAQDSEYPMCIV